MGNRTAREFFIEVVADRCQVLSGCLEPLLIQVYPTDTPRRFCLALKTASTELYELALKLADRFPLASPEEQAEIDIEVSLISSFVDVAMGDWCPMLAASSVENIPAEAIKPIDRMVKHLFADAEIIVQGTADLNYFYLEIGQYIRTMFTTVGLPLLLDQQAIPDEIFLIGICTNPPNGILTHCVIAHEIGHALYEKLEIDKLLIPMIIYDEKAVSQWIDQIISLWASDQEAEAPSQVALEQSREFVDIAARAGIQAVAARWVRELFCDVVGVGLFGPAFICSISLFTMPGSDPSHCSETHPPDSMRTRLCLRALFNKKTGFAYIKDDDDLVTAMTAPWSTYVQEHNSAPGAPNLSITFKAVTRISIEIIKLAKRSIGPKNIFSQKLFAYWVSDLAARIVAGLPPNEVRRAGLGFEVATFPAIMNAGWYVYLFQLPELHHQMPAFKPAELKSRFYGLVSKGVDAAELQGQWTIMKEQMSNDGD